MQTEGQVLQNLDTGPVEPLPEELVPFHWTLLK